MSGKRLTEIEKLQVLSYYNEGNSQIDVANHFGIGVDYVRSIVKKYGTLRSKEENNKFKGAKKIEFNSENISSIINYYRENSLERTAEKFNVSIDTISRILKENNYKKSNEDKINLIAETRKKATREKYPLDETDIINMYLKGESTQIICQKYHLQNYDLNKILEYNNIEKRTKEEVTKLRKSTLFNNYGVEVPLHSSEICKKKEKTTMERYGVSNVGALPEIKEKREATCLLKYGDKIPSKTKYVKDKVKQTNLKKFGVEHFLTLPEIQEKKKKSLIKLYGCETPFSNKEVFLKAKQTMLDRYGAENALQLPEFRSKQAKSSKMSKLEKRFEEFLINNKFNYIHRYIIEGTPYNHEFDFAILNDEGNLDILIDCDGYFYHGYISDEDGKKVNTYIDDYRSSLVPEGVKFLICLEGEEENAYKEVLHLININYDQYIQNIFNWCREVEFPYPNYNNNILNHSFNSLYNSDTENFSTNARYGMKIIDHFHPSIWKANKNSYISPYNAWQDDLLLIKSIKNRIIYKGCNLDRSKVLSGFSINKIAPKVSVFNPNLAKYIINKYLSQYEEIFDPCSGYSGRLLGACSLGKKYIGQDINPITVKESNQIINYFNLNAQITCKDLLQDIGEYECLFTCTPYNNKESWNQEIKNKSCDEWIDEILSKYKCKEYIFVVDKTEKYSQYIVEEIENKSHFNKNKEYIIKISN